MNLSKLFEELLHSSTPRAKSQEDRRTLSHGMLHQHCWCVASTTETAQKRRHRQVRQVLLQVNHRRVGAPPAKTEPLKDPLRPGSTRGHVKFLRFGFDLSVAALLSSEGGER